MATCILKISTARTKLGNSRGKQKNLSHLGSNNLCFKQSHVKLEMCVCVFIYSSHPAGRILSSLADPVAYRCFRQSSPWGLKMKTEL